MFYGREEALEKTKEIITGPHNRPLVLHGEGGCGKTSLLAKAASMSTEWLPNGKPVLILRFSGTTPDSSALTPLLTSLCQQVKRASQQSSKIGFSTFGQKYLNTDFRIILIVSIILHLALKNSQPNQFNRQFSLMTIEYLE